MIQEHDAETRHCPMLGHEIAFSYCRSPGQEIPCRKIYDCWWETFDIARFVEENFPEGAIETVSAPARGKLASLLEIMTQAQRNSPPQS